MNILQMSLSASILIFVVVIIRAIGINKLPKKIFIILWVLILCRLIIPFSLPFKLSVYNLFKAQDYAILYPITQNIDQVSLSNLQEYAVQNNTTQSIVQTSKHISMPNLVWLIGVLICIFYFAISYIRIRKELNTSLPANDSFINNWLNDNAKRKIKVHISDKISSPLVYDVFKPKILLPKTVDFNKKEQLKYILTHELTHINNFDALTKFIAFTALALHWFNPLVWIMFILLNRDLELICDEMVIRKIGEESKIPYIITLINFADKRNRTLLYSQFSKFAIEERTEAIMNMKKKSFIIVLLSLVIFSSAALVFATSSNPEGKNNFINKLYDINEKNNRSNSKPFSSENMVPPFTHTESMTFADIHGPNKNLKNFLAVIPLTPELKDFYTDLGNMKESYVGLPYITFYFKRGNEKLAYICLNPEEVDIKRVKLNESEFMELFPSYTFDIFKPYVNRVDSLSKQKTIIVDPVNDRSTI